MPPAYDTVRYAPLAGRSVLITGGASGIGAEMVRAFGAQRAKVAFLDIDQENGERLASRTGTEFLRCDVTDLALLKETIQALEARHGGFDVLVNNAGCDERHALDAVDPAYWRRLLALNLDHRFFATQAVADGMARRGRGSVIMLGSTSWMRGRPGMVATTTAKAAINGMTKTLARERGAGGIRVNSIVPGAILTERQQRLWLTSELDRQFVRAAGAEVRLDASHVARMALFLAFDESSGCTGANFLVDAGLVRN